MNCFIAVIRYRGDRIKFIIAESFQEACKATDQKIKEISLLYPYDTIQINIYKSTLTDSRIEI